MSLTADEKSRGMVVVCFIKSNRGDSGVFLEGAAGCTASAAPSMENQTETLGSILHFDIASREPAGPSHTRG